MQYHGNAGGGLNQGLLRTKMSKPDKKKEESLERLQNQLRQAELNGDTALVRKIRLIIDRIKGKK